MQTPFHLPPRDSSRLRELSISTRPASPAHLHQWLRLVLDVDVPRRALLQGSDAPFDYLCWAFFDESRGETSEGSAESPRTLSPSAASASDAVVWACRGGGKTFYAAVATLLDLIFKPGIEVKVLGGSLDQAGRMHEHLRRLFERPHLTHLVERRFGMRRAALTNGSTLEILAQSERAVRGTRPQRLRCDEVELFDPDVWRAAQLVTRSKLCGVPPGDSRRLRVRAGIEALSTMHRAGGIMSDLVTSADEQGRRVFRWGLIDVLEYCPPPAESRGSRGRECARCPLLEECGSRARDARREPGHFSIDDAVAAKRRADRDTWSTEMLCASPSARHRVYPGFDPAIHVFDRDPPRDELALRGPCVEVVCGMDPGFRGSTVVLWATRSDDDVIRIIAERCIAGVRLDEHIAAILRGDPSHGLAYRPGVDAPSDAEASMPVRLPTPAWVAIDPAGLQRSAQTGEGAVGVLRKHGLNVRHRRLSLEAGIALVRARIEPAAGSPRLLVHRRCANLIRALRSYRWPDEGGEGSRTGGAPVKDGHDHAADALRYLVINLDAPPSVRVLDYAGHAPTRAC